MILNYLCPPALLYVVFFLIQIVIEISHESYKQALTQSIICVIFTCILQIFCNANLTLIAWLLVFIPVIMYTYMVLLIFMVFRLNPDEAKKYLISK
jgi:ABC-type bacteriocin/lantibiotic exporter with double-glycine peptidase domain